jgi:uncharacterized protein
MAVLSPTKERPVPLVHPTKKEAAAVPVASDPGLLGLPAFIVGAVALALVQIGVVPIGTTGASLPILLTATSAGLFLATYWAATAGQSMVAGVYGIFGGFYLSYAALVLGLIHNWFGITLPAVVATQKVFLISWLVVVTLLTLATLRLPSVFTALFALIDVALVFALLGVIQASANMTKVSGYVILAFSALGAYLFFGAASQATGGKAVPLGKPILHA